MRLIVVGLAALPMLLLSGCVKGRGTETPPTPISGGGKYILTPSNARVLCNFSGQDKQYTITCRAAVMVDGVQHYADALAAGVTLEWALPQPVSGAALDQSSCPGDRQALTWSCDVTLAVAEPSRLQMNLEIKKSGVPEKTEYAQVALGAVSSFGAPPQAPFRYLVAPPETLANIPVGYRNQQFDPMTTQFGGSSGVAACEVPGALVFTSGEFVYVLRDGKAQLLAGSPNANNAAELSHPYRTFLGSGKVRVYCPPPSGRAGDPPAAIYISSESVGRVFRLEATGASIELFAGRFDSGTDDNGGIAKGAYLFFPAQVAFAPDGSVYIAERLRNRIRKVDPNGRITTVAGNGDYGALGSAADGTLATQGPLQHPAGVALLPDGSFLFTEHGSLKIRKVGPDGILSTIAGTGVGGHGGDGGPARQATVSNPTDIVALGQEDILFIDGPYSASLSRIRRVRDGIISTPSWAAALEGVTHLSLAPDRTLLVTRSPASVTSVVRVDLATGAVTPLVNAPVTPVFLADGDDTRSAPISKPGQVALLPDGSVVAAFPNENRIRKIDPRGVITTLAGSGEAGSSADGVAAVSARIREPRAVAVGPDGTVYFSEGRPLLIRKIEADGTLATVFGESAGVVEVQAAKLAAGPDGSLYYRSNSVIHRIAPDGTISDVATTGVKEDGDFVLDGTGRLFYVDSSMIQFVARRGGKGGEEGRSTIVAGGGEVKVSEAPEGADALTLKLGIDAITVDAAGSLYVVATEQGSQRILRLRADSSGSYRVSTVLGGSSGRDCGAGGIVRVTGASSAAEGTLQASASVMCLGYLGALAVTTLQEASGLVHETLTVGQSFSVVNPNNSGNILKLERFFAP